MSNEELNAQITSLKAELEKMTELAGIYNEAWYKAEDAKIILGRKNEALKEKVEKFKKISLASNDKWELEFNKHMETKKLLDAHKEGYDTMLSINKEAIQEIDLLEIKNKRYIADAKEYKKQRDEYRISYICLKHAEATGSLGRPDTTLWDAYENGIYYSLEELKEAYEDEELKEVEDFMRKREGLPTFCEEWKKRVGLDYPKYYEGNCVIGEDDE